MSDIAIRVENLSKQYTIGRARERHDTLRDALAGVFRRNGSGGATETFWALKDISFEVKRGEVVGIIGRNGAGKSTLLKVLSQITEPTSGRAEIHGRVGSLLEVGTGFHPELTGRENIYLNGAILGMRREEIARKFDEIVAFSEIEKFLDTPVKRYSSGMYVRLAFAVAAHLEPEILLVDEVLAVGDAAFQKKALGKMGDVVHEGRTVLFVSHNMNAVQRLCKRALLIDRGNLVMDRDAATTVEKYQFDSTNVADLASWMNLADVSRDGAGEPKFVAVRIFGDEGNNGKITTSSKFHVDVIIRSKEEFDVQSMAVTVYDRNATKLVNADIISRGEYISLRKGLNHYRFTIDKLYLTAGTYVLGLYLSAGSGREVYDRLPTALLFDVSNNEIQEKYGIQADGAVPCEFNLSEFEVADSIEGKSKINY